jgi:hypothetical protein
MAPIYPSYTLNGHVSFSTTVFPIVNTTETFLLFSVPAELSFFYDLSEPSDDAIVEAYYPGLNYTLPYDVFDGLFVYYDEDANEDPDAIFIQGNLKKNIFHLIGKKIKFGLEFSPNIGHALWTFYKALINALSHREVHGKDNTFDEELRKSWYMFEDILDGFVPGSRSRIHATRVIVVDYFKHGKRTVNDWELLVNEPIKEIRAILNDDEKVTEIITFHPTEEGVWTVVERTGINREGETYHITKKFFIPNSAFDKE